MCNKTIILLILVLGVTISGCAGTGPKNVERDYGNSVRQMIAGQTLDPSTAAKPDPDAVDSGDGERLNNVLETYRGDVAKPEEVGQPIVISVGSQ